METSKLTISERLIQWFIRHKLDVFVLAIIVGVSGAVSALNMEGYPQRFEDEGTYVSQAYAIKEDGKLTHYTYWYDHPPVGWIQIAAYLFATDALDRYGSAISAGREFMLVLHLATIVLMYALARRLGIGTVASTAGVLLYGLSPLSVEFSRYVLLDNVALPWLLGAFLLALSPRRTIGTAIGAAICMAVAVLSKETFAILLPVLIYALWRNGDARNRRYTFTAFSVVFIMISLSYLLYATLKGELLPGDGHVSLLGTTFWQLFGREGSGSILDQSSGSYGLLRYWLNIDYVLVAAGVVGLIPALIYRSLRPIGLVLLIGLLMLLRTGYLPYPYIIVLLPFAALCFAGALDRLLIRPLKNSKPFPRIIAGVAMIEFVVLISFVVVPVWQLKLNTSMKIDQDASSRQTVEWVAQNIPRSSRMVVESALWADLGSKGFDQPEPVWLYKTETDPAVQAEIGGWQGIDYVVLNGPTLGASNFDESFPTVSNALKESELVAEFGKGNQKVMVYKVNTTSTTASANR